MLGIYGVNYNMFLWMIIDEKLDHNSKLFVKASAIDLLPSFKDIEFHLRESTSPAWLLPDGRYVSGKIIYDLYNNDQQLHLRYNEEEIREYFDIVN